MRHSPSTLNIIVGATLAVAQGGRKTRPYITLFIILRSLKGRGLALIVNYDLIIGYRLLLFWR
jgi:hypothetical protein